MGGAPDAVAGVGGGDGGCGFGCGCCAGAVDEGDAFDLLAGDGWLSKGLFGSERTYGKVLGAAAAPETWIYY